MDIVDPMIGTKPQATPTLYHAIDVLISGILVFLILNLFIRSSLDMQTKDPVKLNPPVLNSIAFCILELIVLLFSRFCFKCAKDGQNSYFPIGFIAYLASVLFFIIESATFYNEILFNSNTYPWRQEKLEQNTYQVVIEVLLRAGVLGVLFFMITKK